MDPITVVVCAFADDRLDQTCASAAALLEQAPPPAAVLLVVDHNEPLRAALAERLPGVRVLANEGPKGLSGGRNTGLDHAATPLVAFVDDDAEAQPGWTAAISAPFDDPAVAVVGGLALPRFDGPVPTWFPPELYWAIGCSYRGMALRDIRNPLGANMAFRSEIVRRAGGFDPVLGRVGSVPFGCEETELCVRIRRLAPEARIVIARDAVVAHHVPVERSSLRYLFSRSFYEGIGKAMLESGSDAAALGAERSFALRVLPWAIFRDFDGLVHLREPGVRARRLLALGGSLALAGAGYGVGRLTHATGPAANAQQAAAGG